MGNMHLHQEWVLRRSLRHTEALRTETMLRPQERVSIIYSVMRIKALLNASPRCSGGALSYRGASHLGEVFATLDKDRGSGVRGLTGWLCQ